MILVNDLHYALLQQGDATNSKYLTELTTVQRDYYLNRAVKAILEIHSKEAEKNSSYADYLIDVTVNDVKLKATLNGDHFLAEYPEDYYHTLGIYVDATKKGCSGTRRFPVRRPPTDKLRRALKNANVKRFWDFEETIARQVNKGYQVFTEPNLEYDIYLDYIKKIPDVAAPEFEDTEKYIDASGNELTQNVNLEINNRDLFHKIVSVAALLTKRDRGLAQDYEMQFKTLVSLDRLQ